MNVIKLIGVQSRRGCFAYCSSSSKSVEDSEEIIDKDEFRTLQILPPKKTERVEKVRRQVNVFQEEPRYKRMSTDIKWSDVWPAARSFHPATVPLPVRQGMVQTKSGTHPPPTKFANLELMKIPNFLHLTPPAIKAQCEELKKFCTKWPEQLKDDESCEKHFPVEVISSSYLNACPTIRDPRSRGIVMKLKMSRLQLDEHAKDKLIRLLDHRYDSTNDEITITADRCPVRNQNYQYAHYLVTACYFESWKIDEWESEKTVYDWEKFYWEKSSSKDSVVSYLKRTLPENMKDGESILEREEVKSYSEAVKSLHEVGNESSLDDYKQSVLKLMFA